MHVHDKLNCKVMAMGMLPVCTVASDDVGMLPVLAWLPRGMILASRKVQNIKHIKVNEGKT